MIERRKFLIGLAAGIVAPAIIPYKSLMPVKAIITPPKMRYLRFRIEGLDAYGNRVVEYIDGNRNPTTFEIVRSACRMTYIGSVSAYPVYST